MEGYVLFRSDTRFFDVFMYMTGFWCFFLKSEIVGFVL